jgi:AraC family transcriptional activator FtrA
MATMTNIAVLLPPGGHPGRLSMYREIFGTDRSYHGGPAFALTFARQGPRAEVSRGRPLGGLDVLAHAEILAVAPGGWRDDVSAEVAAALRAAVRRNCRIVAVGAAVLTVAAAGLLDGRPAAASAEHAEELRRRYPRVRAAVGVRFVDDDPIFTAAAGTAGVDLCLHLVRKYHGAAAATAVTRSMRRRRRPLRGEPHQPPCSSSRQIDRSH